VTFLDGDLFLGTKIHWLDFGNNIICMVLNLLKNSLQILLDAVADGTLERYCIRITEYSKVIDLLLTTSIVLILL
jgi:hypothetical protein